MILELTCSRQGHGIIERPTHLERSLERAVISERICRSCSRHRSTPRIRRTVYHRWDLSGERLKDRVERWDRQDHD
jgi:hypothetical protein